MSRFSSMLSVFVIVAICCVLLGCGAPDEVKSLAIKEAGAGFNEDVELKDFKIVKEEKDSISSADKANGITDRWTFDLSYICRRKVGVRAISPSVGPDWQNGSRRVVITKKNGRLETRWYH